MPFTTVSTPSRMAPDSAEVNAVTPINSIRGILDSAVEIKTGIVSTRKSKQTRACQACRARRIKCDWGQEADRQRCISCVLANIPCPGPSERKPRSRKKANHGSARSTFLALQSLSPLQSETRIHTSQFAGALSYHLIEVLLEMANPSVPSAQLSLFRDLLAAGGQFQVLEEPSECLCAAIIASAATLTNHSSIVGPGAPTLPTELPSVETSPMHLELYTKWGSCRRHAVETLRKKAEDKFEQANFVQQPSIETTYIFLALDQMHTLTSEMGRTHRKYVDLAICHFRLLMDNMSDGVPAEKRAMYGPLGNSLLSLDATTAAILRLPLAFSASDLLLYFPTVDFQRLFLPTFSMPPMTSGDTAWVKLGRQLEPLGLMLSVLYRNCTQIVHHTAMEVSEIYQLWGALEVCTHHLANVDADIISLTAFDAAEPALCSRRFDLLSLTNAYGRSAFRLYLLLHERILEMGALDDSMDPTYMANLYETSRERVRRTFRSFVQMARQHIVHRSVIQARRLLEVMDISFSWSAMRGSSAVDVSTLIVELGLSKADCIVLAQLCELAGWSSEAASQQLQGLQQGMRLAQGQPQNYGEQSLPYPATSMLIPFHPFSVPPLLGHRSDSKQHRGHFPSFYPPAFPPQFWPMSRPQMLPAYDDFSHRQPDCITPA